ncbi:MAG: hypothetical protein FIA96_05665 [Betaproteobacteria bacterium]|nr:hypothetical protein [Betaproteobacteria bacterium]
MSKPLEQLAWPLAVSLALHLGAVWVFLESPLFPRKQGRTVTLTVTLVSNQQPEPRNSAAAEPVPVPPPAPPAEPAATSAQNSDGQITEKARFLVAPDLSALENIAVPVSGNLTVRLHVSSLGTVDRVELLKSDPIPRDVLDGVLEKIRQARLIPALAGSQPVASTLNLEIRYEPAADPLQRVP